MTIISASSGGSGSGEDHHSGWYYIAGTVTVSLYKQMTTWGILVVDGTLLIDGQLITEP